MNKDCVFCKIARGEISCEKILEDEDFIAFLDVNPVGEGHTLLISKKHFDDLMSLDEEISIKYVKTIQKVGKILMDRYKSSGFNLILNNGVDAGQIIKHVHFHILPRKENDGIKEKFIFG